MSLKTNLDAAGNVCGKWAKKSTGLALVLFIIGLICKIGADNVKDTNSKD